MNTTCIQMENLKRSFGSGENAVHVLRGINLTVAAGHIVAFYGSSGSGKTTLLNLVGALDKPDEGEISVCGRDIVQLKARVQARLRRTQIGFIFQRDSLLPTYTAYENIDLALRLAGKGYIERQRQTRIALAAVGLSAWAGHLPGELSGGQRQRVAIARALAIQPQVILADEPTNGLDVQIAQRILALFRAIAEQRQTTFVLASHDPLVMDYVDQAYDLYEGRLKPHHEYQKDDVYAMG